MALDDVYDVLRQNRPSEPVSRPSAAGGTAPPPPLAPPRRGSSWGAWKERFSRDRVLLGSIVFLLYSVALVGAGIAIGRSRGAASLDTDAPARTEGGAAAAYLTVRALELTGGDAARPAAESAIKELRSKFPQYPVFDLVQGRDRAVCVGRFPVDPTGRVPDEVNRLKEAVSTMSFGVGKNRRRFDRVQVFKVQP